MSRSLTRIQQQCAFGCYLSLKEKANNINAIYLEYGAGIWKSEQISPGKYNISFARFINQYRDTLPDIDFDFPHYLRDEVFLKLFQKWGHRVARISNHNYYHEKISLERITTKKWYS